MKTFCISAIEILKTTNSKDWATVFVELKMGFCRIYSKGLIFSTIHGIDFFDNVLYCLNGGEWEEEGEYGNNFRKLIVLNKNL